MPDSCIILLDRHGVSVLYVRQFLFPGKNFSYSSRPNMLVNVLTTNATRLFICLHLMFLPVNKILCTIRNTKI